MTALSSADKMRLRISAKRVEAWKVERMRPHSKINPKDKTSTIMCFGHDKPDEVIVPDMMDSVHRASDGYAVRTSASKYGHHGSAIAARVSHVEHTSWLDGKVTTQCVQHVEVEQELVNVERHVTRRDGTLSVIKGECGLMAKGIVPVVKTETRPVMTQARKDSPFKRAKGKPVIVERK